MNKYKVTIQFCKEGDQEAQPFLECTFSAPDGKEADRVREYIEGVTGSHQVVPEMNRIFEAIVREQ